MCKLGSHTRFKMVLMMMHNTHNYWALNFVHHPVFWKLENTTFWKLDLFPPSGEAEIHALLGPLERANLNHWWSNDWGMNVQYRQCFWTYPLHCTWQYRKPTRPVVAAPMWGRGELCSVTEALLEPMHTLQSSSQVVGFTKSTVHSTKNGEVWKHGQWLLQMREILT
jgi:hypothetical protein